MNTPDETYWLAENSVALKSSNRFVELQALPVSRWQSKALGTATVEDFSTGLSSIYWPGNGKVEGKWHLVSQRESLSKPYGCYFLDVLWQSVQLIMSPLL